MPKRGRPPVAHPRNKTIAAAVTEDELAAIDKARGDVKRSAWLRALIDAALASVR